GVLPSTEWKRNTYKRPEQKKWYAGETISLGIGQLTGIDVRGEARGVLPSTEWKRNTYKRPEQKKWYAGETISLGIGQ
ncbi:hypothetical protein, partial [Escherichia coli]|uniref:hypothetical protein n=1 Tax=Escherichia coli TaxID=562 RepID=UPI001125AF16